MANNIRRSKQKFPGRNRGNTHMMNVEIKNSPFWKTTMLNRIRLKYILENRTVERVQETCTLG